MRPVLAVLFTSVLSLTGCTRSTGQTPPLISAEASNGRDALSETPPQGDPSETFVKQVQFLMGGVTFTPGLDAGTVDEPTFRASFLASLAITDEEIRTCRGSVMPRRVPPGFQLGERGTDLNGHAIWHARVDFGVDVTWVWMDGRWQSDTVWCVSPARR
jgi:hypothetical protein